MRTPLESITDWNGSLIKVGDTVLYAPGESGLTLGEVLKIDSEPTTLTRGRYDTPTGQWVRGAQWIRYDENVPHIRVRVRGRRVGSKHITTITISSISHVYAFPSLTKFSTEKDVDIDG